MRIVLLNLRDHKHPQAGGAERFTYEVARRWVAEGHDVDFIASHFRGAPREEVDDGIRIIRLANYFAMQAQARRYYERHLKGNCDVVVDEYTNIPFLTPQYVHEPIIFLVHEVIGEKYREVLPPLAGRLMHEAIESHWYEYYRDVETVTVSKSTRDDLLTLGISNVHVVTQGIGNAPLERVPPKEAAPTMLFVGLLKKANLVDDCITAFARIEAALPDAQLWIVGRGSELERLRSQAKGLNVSFFGYVDEARKLELMGRAHILLVPGIREGWGLVITEANACGTPAIGYDIVGFRDSIRDGETGLLVEATPDAMARSAIRLLNDRDWCLRLSEAALRWSGQFSWDKTAAEFLEVIKHAVGEPRPEAHSSTVSVHHRQHESE